MAPKRPPAEADPRPGSAPAHGEQLPGRPARSVTLDDWREIVNQAKQSAKAGNPHARAWLSQYLMGRPQSAAPTPLAVVVSQWGGTDPLVEKLAQPLIEREMVPSLRAFGAMEDEIRELVAAELAGKVDDGRSIEPLPAAQTFDRSTGRSRRRLPDDFDKW